MAIGDSARYGYNSCLGISEETTFGTKNDSYSYLEFLNESMKRNREEVKLDSINKGRDFEKRLSLNESVDGSVESNFNPAADATVFLVKQAFGGTVSSANVATSTIDNYLHTINLGDMESNAGTSTASDVKSLSFQVDKGGIVWDYVGCRVNTLTIKAEAGGPVMISADLVGKTASITSSTPTAVFVDTLPLDFTGVTFETGDSLTNVSAESVQSFEVTLNNNMNTDQRSLGDRTIDLLPPIQREITVKVSQRFDTTTAHNRYLDNTITAIKITLSSSQTITSSTGSAVYEAILNLPRCYLNSNQPEVGGKDVLTHELDFAALKNNTTTAFALQMTVQNGTASYL